MELGERKKRILQAIVDDYIGTAEPVGSRTIAKKHELGLSSATIRNEMADLEEMGFLQQPHASSGRIPSDLGYRFYVDQLMRRYEFSVEEMSRMRQIMELQIQELDRLILQASEFISKVTQYTTVAVTPKISKSAIKHLQLIPVDLYNILLIFITHAGIVRNKSIRLKQPVSAEFIQKLSAVLDDKLRGLTIEEINLPKIQEIQREMKYNEELLISILNIIADSISDIDKAEVYLGGATNIFNFPEYNQIDKAKELLGFLEERRKLYELFSSHNKDNKITIMIGRENQFEEIKNCSVVMTNYYLGDEVVGTIGIIGPTRMDYAKIVSSLEFLSKNLSRIILKTLRGTDDS